MTDKNEPAFICKTTTTKASNIIRCLRTIRK